MKRYRDRGNYRCTDIHTVTNTAKITSRVAQTEQHREKRTNRNTYIQNERRRDGEIEQQKLVYI
jgi:hypothetical protein